MQLLSAVQSGRRPVIPDDSPQCIVQLVQKCWRMKSVERPNISEISQKLEEYLEAITSSKELENSLVEQDISAKGINAGKNFDVPSISSKFDINVIDGTHDSPEGMEFHLEIDNSLGSSQNSLISKQNGNDLDASIDIVYQNLMFFPQLMLSQAVLVLFLKLRMK